MNNILLFIGGLIVLILGALFAVPMFVDWNSYRGVFEEEASRLIGRDVRVNGAVNLRLLPTPTVRFEGVRVADAAGRTGEPFFRADNFTLHLAVSPLLQGVVEATDIELKRPVLRIAFDENGGANWRGLRSGDQRTGFVPKDLALPSVRITDGTIVVHGHSGDEKLRLEKINGEVGAPSLEGPYKARLAYTIAGSAQEARIATARAEADGTVRLKATVRVAASGASWALDGRLVDLQDKPGIKGDVTAKLPLAATGKSAEAFDLKAVLSADAAGFAVDDLAMSFEQEGRPQLLVGALKGTWRDKTAVDLQLSSHWLDLDRISGVTEKTPLRIVGRLAEGLDWLPRAIKVSVTAKIEQASIAGDVASNLVVALDRSESAITVRELRAAVPGGTRIEARGIIGGAGTPDQRFDGEILARGASLARALGWAFKGLPMPEVARDGSFGFGAKLSIGARQIFVNDVSAELNGNPVAGSLSYSWTDRTRLAIAIEGAEVDAGVFAIGDLGLRPILAALASGEPIRRGARPERLPDTIRARLNAGRLLAADRSFRDVAADLLIEATSIGIESLRATTEDGIAVELSGRLTGLDARPKGTLGWQLGAGDAKSIATALDQLGLPPDWRVGVDRLATLTPLRLAGTLAVGQRTTAARDLTLDGMANTSRVSGALRLDVGPKGIAEMPTDLTAELSSPEVGKLLRQLVPAQAVAITERFGQGKGRLRLKAIGRLAAGIVSLATLDAPGLAAEYSGRIGLAGNRIALDGNTRIDGELSRVLVVAGLGARPGYEGVGVQGSAHLVVKDGALRIDGSALKIAGADVSARARWPAGSSDKLQLDVRASDVSLAGLLGLVLDNRGRPGESSPSPANPAIWPENSFDLSALEHWPATIRLEAGRLHIAKDIAIQDATLGLQIGAGRAGVAILGGKSAGGAITGKLSIARSAAGAELTGDFRVMGIDLAKLAPGPAGGTPPAIGKANIIWKLAGKALSPRGLVAVLEGKGQIELGPVRLARFSPAAVSAAVDAAITSKEPIGEADLRRKVGEMLAAGELLVTPHRLPIEIVEGQVRVSELSVDTPEARVVAKSLVDLETLRLDSDWRLEPKPAGTDAKRPALPPVTIVFSGPLAQIGTLVPDLKTDALAREITVRRMEREVEELERLRREDEARALLEAEKQKALVPQAPVEPPPAPAGAVPAPVPAPSAGVVVPVPPPAAAPTPEAAPKSDVRPPEPKSAPIVPPAPRPAKRPQFVNPFKTDSGG